MSWEYSQQSRTLKHNGVVVAEGYSGHGAGRNNPDMENVANVGPIPRGRYTIGGAHQDANKGPVVIRLTPFGHNARGRSGFLIHGDNAQGNFSASEGCIILNRAARELISNSGDSMLDVVR